MNTNSFDDLTLRQRDVLGFVIDFKRRNDGNAPSTREIMAACQLHSTSHVRGILRHLDRKGFITLAGDPGASRRIEVTGGHWTFNKPEEQSGDA